MMSLLDGFFPALGVPIPDALAAPVWLLANVLLVGVAWKWARRLFPRDSYLELLQHTVVLCWAGITVVATALGGVGWLSGPTLLLGIVTLSVVAAAACRVTPAGPPFGPVPLERAERFWLALWAVLFSLWVGHVLTEGLGRFPTDWDSLAYHIPLVDHWLQAHSLNATGCARWANPGNNELWALWAVAPFSGDFLLSLNNLPAALLLGCSAVALATRIGLPRPLAHLGGFALVSNFVVLKQLIDAENDMAAAACFVAALTYALRHVEDAGRASLALGAVSLGLLAGIKYYALGYAALALVVWLGGAALVQGPRAALRVLLVGVGGLIAWGSYWYLRNWLLTGSPLYPREFFKPHDALSHIYPEVARTSFFGNGRPELFGLYAEAIWQRMGPCQLAGFLLAPVSLGWLLGSAVWYSWRRRDLAQAWKRAALAVLLLGTGLLLGLTPFAVEDRPGTLNQVHWHYCPVRYGLCFLSTATLALLFLLRDFFLGRRGPEKEGGPGEPRARQPRWLTGLRWLAYLVLAGAILFQIPWAGRRLPVAWVDNLLIGADLVLVGLAAGLLGTRWPRLRTWLALTLLLAALPAWALVCARLAERWHQGFTAHYDPMRAFAGLQQLEQHGSGPPTILVLQSRCYPYFGSRRQHRVYQPVYVPSPEWLLELIRKKDVTLVVTDLPQRPVGHRRFLGFAECLARHPQRFRLVQGSGTVFAFEVVPHE